MKYRKQMVLLTAALLLAAPMSVRAEEAPAVDFNRPSIVEEEEERMEEGVIISDMDVSGLTREEAEALLTEKYCSLSAADFIVQVDDVSVTTNWNRLGLRWELDEVLDEAMAIGKGSGLIGKYKALTDMDVDGCEREVPCEIQDEQVRSFVEKQIKVLEGEPVNASLTREDGKFVVHEQQNGRTINVEETVKAIEESAAAGMEAGQTVAAVEEFAEPEIKTEDVETVQDLLGSCTTDVSGSSNRHSNVALGASNINGKLLMPGESASASEMMQKRTAANGYKKAPQYANGQSVDAIGGGICQVSSTLYNALLAAEIQIDERHPHSMVVSYLDPSKDAAISDGYKDLKFTNNLEYPIYIEGYYHDGQLTFNIYGSEYRPAERTVKYISTTVYRNYPEDIVKYDPNQPVGYKEVTGSRHPSVKSYLEKVVYMDGEEVSRETLHTDQYNSSARTVTMGSKEPDPVPTPVPETQPTETQPTESQPVETQPAETQPTG